MQPIANHPQALHGLFPYHLQFTSGDSLFFLWLALAEEGGILGGVTGIMFDLLLPFPSNGRHPKGHVDFDIPSNSNINSVSPKIRLPSTFSPNLN